MSGMELDLVEKELLFLGTMALPPFGLTCGNRVQMCSLSTAQTPIWDASGG